tara:strand:+ start:1358 stop:1762 length:405 start_codon:yes stop_codon:yes gene_type:complete
MFHKFRIVPVKNLFLILLFVFSTQLISKESHAEFREIERGSDYVEYISMGSIHGYTSRFLRNRVSALFHVNYSPPRQNGLTKIIYIKKFNCKTGDIRVSNITYFAGNQYLSSNVKGTGEIHYNPKQTAFVCQYK